MNLFVQKVWYFNLSPLKIITRIEEYDYSICSPKFVNDKRFIELVRLRLVFLFADISPLSLVLGPAAQSSLLVK